ncbi:hypothetical protein [Bacillus phage PM1]|uniref:Replication-relaxation n=1 Tax=Bacillus phage PM1 TaxID=547228 RepID=M5AC25_9CAUD|nr:replication initiation protein [Bacillus phage PM1]BAM99164.1 hypothetical protein [Bacillus phage PM1]
MGKLKERQERILLSLKQLDFLSRSQLQELHFLGTARNAVRVMSHIDEYVNKYREDKDTIYYLNAKGREYVDSNKIRKRTNKVNHILLRNQYYIHLGCPQDWKNEVKYKFPDFTLIPDAVYSIDGYLHFLEVDITQSMRENRKKVEVYQKAFDTGAFQSKYGHFPVLVWLTTTEHRRKHLKEACKKLPCEIITTLDIN